MWHTSKYSTMCITAVPGREETKRAEEITAGSFPLRMTTIEMRCFLCGAQPVQPYAAVSVYRHSHQHHCHLCIPPTPALFSSKITILLYSGQSKLSSELVLSHSSTYLFPCQLLFLAYPSGFFLLVTSLSFLPSSQAHVFLSDYIYCWHAFWLF